MIETKEDLDNFIVSNWMDIGDYLDGLQANYPTPIYTSVDIRESKKKYAPVDNNFYPAGFNNICTLDINSAIPHFQKHINKLEPDIKNIGLISESNTRNTFYLDHLAILKKCLRDAGYNVYIISFDQELFTEQQELHLISHSSFEVQLHKAFVDQEIIHLESDGERIELCLCIMNNDQSAPIAIDWTKLKTKVDPSPLLGWNKRTKANHFKCYDLVLQQFCQKFDIDSRLMQASFKHVDGVDFSSKEGLELVASRIDELKNRSDCEKIFVKADQGTYGMGIHVVSSGEEMLSLNRKQRNKLDVGKNRKKFTSVLIQEGVETVLKWDEQPAEVTIYLVGGQSVGGFMRTNSLKDANSNLNAKGMVFQKFCISEIRQDEEHKLKEAVYSVIARLSSIAGGMEIANSLEENK